MQRRITGLRQDADGEWIAALECGHERHVRHNPPWRVAAWVTTQAGRASAIGLPLECRRCAHSESQRAPDSTDPA